MEQGDIYNLVRKNYDNVDLDFHNSYDSREEFPEEMAAVANSAAGKRALMIGGSMAECEYFLDRGFEVTDLDISQSILDDLGRNPKIKLVNSKAQEFHGSGYGCVWACRSLFHVPPSDIDNCLRSIHSLMKDGGVAGIIVFPAPGDDIVEQRIEDKMSLADGEATTYYRVLYPANTFKAKIKAAGFKKCSFEVLCDEDGDQTLSVLAYA